MSLLQQMQLDFNGALSNHNTVMQKVSEWNNTARSGGFGNESSDGIKSVYVSKDVQKAIESAMPSLVEPFLNKNITNVQGKDAQSDKKAEVVEKLLNYQWSYGLNSLEFMENTTKSLMSDGTVFTKVGWTSDMPTLELIPIDRLLLDPSATKLKDCRFIIERKKVSISEILNNPQWYGSHTLDSLAVLNASTSTEYDVQENGVDTSFNFEDRLRQLIDVNTYYGQISDDGKIRTIVGVWSDNFLLNLTDSPYPESWEGIPFSSTKYISVAGSIYGEALAELLWSNQAVRSGLQRSILDTLDKSTAGQKGISTRALNPIEAKKFANGDDFTFNGEMPAIWQGEYNQVPGEVYALMDRLQQDSEELSGISRQNGGLDPRSLNSNVSATAASLTNTAAERRLLLITRHISSLLEDVFRKWLDLNQMMLESGSVRIGGEVLDIAALDLDGNYDLSINVGTSGLKKERVNNLSMVLGTLSSNPAIPPHISIQLMADMTEALDLHSTSEQLDLIAKQMQMQAEQPQQPNPEQQMAMQLEFEAKQAQITKDKAQAKKYEADAVNTYVETEMSSYGLN